MTLKPEPITWAGSPVTYVKPDQQLCEELLEATGPEVQPTLGGLAAYLGCNPDRIRRLIRTVLSEALEIVTGERLAERGLVVTQGIPNPVTGNDLRPIMARWSYVVPKKTARQ